jgi:Protein of unknown function (DUF3300)
MRLQEHLHASLTAGFFSPPPESTSNLSPACNQCPCSALKRCIAHTLALALVPLGAQSLFAQQAPPEPDANMDQPYSAQYDPGQQQGYPQPQQSYSGPTPYGQAQGLTADQLEQLVAPIALYPDALVAQVLAASTYPAQVVDADRWRQAQGYASSDDIAAGANLQNWDPSLKALTAFPQVLAEMDQNLQWTTALGNVYYNQPQDVLQAIQVMRQRAQAAGNLQSTPQQWVNYNQGYIQVAPVNPEVVYVPAYNPWTVYGQPVSPYPGFSLFGAVGSLFNSSVVRFGLGMVMTAFTHSPWGWLGWGLNWLTQNVLFHQSNYSTRSTSVADWGLPHGGPRAFPRGSSMVQASSNYYRSNPGGYRQTGRGDNPYPGQGFFRAQDRYSAHWSGENRRYQPPAFGNTRPPLQGYNRAPLPVARAQTYSRPAYGSANNPAYRSAFDSSRQMYASRPGQSYASSLQAYNRNPAFSSGPQTYGRSSYGSGFYNNSGSYNPSTSAYGARPAQTFTSSLGAYRSPSAGFQRNGYEQRSPAAAMGNGFKGSPAKAPRSGGFHLFGGSHSSDSFHEPKGFGREKSIGGHSGDGFHSFGGSHHSGGGGHSGGHSHGGHHR